ncbi:uncharacterized protein N7498_001603 [Penicillium cinerascens]|uniref:RING-type domain-containing protein n=1 Tax=Penicillium cinerascens TaxID=70096 RepID=A0A9W9TAB4_9EURO|nr:uncharacterized protein N7498_001603 [Penicillium cinerascens]KAJ5215196.1 hypothetical protein N7498_001603 [Penicillium cinerascens]
MGQSSSTARHSPDASYTDYPPPSSISRDTGTRNEDMNNRQAFEQNAEAGTSSGVETHLQSGPGSSSDQSHEPLETWHQPTRPSGGLSHPMRSIEEEEGTDQESAERDYRSAAIARMAARRQSTMSRLGSRILPNSVIRGLLNSQEETPAEGHAHRHGLVSRTPPRSETAHSTGRFSPFSALGSRGVTRRRSARGPYFIPPRTDSSPIPETTTNPTFLDNSSERITETNRASWRRSARLHRMRHSLSTPISHMFGQPQSNVSPHEIPPHSSPRPSLSDGLPSAMDTRLDFDEPLHELDSVEPSVHNDGPLSSNQPNPHLMRRLPGLMRARSSRALRREEQTPLSRVLQLAAAAIAAQLSGTTGPALPNIQALGNDGLEGSLENFIQSLQSATSAQAQPPTAGEGPSIPENEGPSPPVNFLRVFRFANSDSPAGGNPLGRSMSSSENQGAQSDGMSVDEPPEGAEGRTVTLVVVGVRSVPAGNGGNGEQGPPAPGGPGLDALLGLPFLPSNAIPRPSEAAGDPIQGRTRLPIPRPTGSPGLPAYGIPETLRQPGLNPSRRLSDAGPRTTYPTFPLLPFPKAPGPPPPAFYPCGTRPSSASAMSPAALPQLHEDRTMQPTVEPVLETPWPPMSARQRRRSDSEFARHRALGSGSVRRNGVVEPDQPPPNGGRSWLIYVVGTNLSENHPALTTPSLFTDNPTYEDMILLSSLLGPAKPPVASQADVNSAGGLFRLVEYGGSLVAEAVNGEVAIQIQDGDRCRICLSDYEVAEEVRELAKCKHVFHKDCIDQWLTTGRNSCPLCRGQGVRETSNTDGSASDPAPSSAPEGMAI